MRWVWIWATFGIQTLYPIGIHKWCYGFWYLEKLSLDVTRHSDGYSKFEHLLCHLLYLWKYTKTLFCITTKELRPWQPIGTWIQGATSHHHWTYFFHPGTKSLIHCAETPVMFCCFHPARLSRRLFHSTSDILFPWPSHRFLVKRTQMTVQFLELTACSLSSHMHTQPSYTSASGVQPACMSSHHLQHLIQILWKLDSNWNYHSSSLFLAFSTLETP